MGPCRGRVVRRHGGVRLRTDSSKINRKEGQDDNIVECQVSDLESILDVACPISSRKRWLGSACPGMLDEFVRGEWSNLFFTRWYPKMDGFAVERTSRSFRRPPKPQPWVKSYVLSSGEGATRPILL